MHPLQKVPPEYVVLPRNRLERRLAHRDSLVLWMVATRPRPLLYSDLMTSTGLPRGQVQRSLWRLRAQGLVTWERGRRGTLRALVTVVPR